MTERGIRDIERRLRSMSGFTLIESMVVILIILVLVGILIPAFSAMRKRQLVLTARTEVKKLREAILLFRKAAGEHPLPTITPPAEQSATVKIDMFYQDLYFAGEEKKWFGTGKTGRMHRPFWVPYDIKLLNGQNEYLDPWGNPYAYYLEREGYQKADGTWATRPRRVIVFSRGPNGIDETTDISPDDGDDIGTFD